MPPLTLALLCLAPGSEAGAPTTDFAINLRLASTTTHAPLSSQWAMSYYQAPGLIGTPAATDAPTPNPMDDAPPELAVIPPEATDEGVPDLLWHDWKMSDMSL